MYRAYQFFRVLFTYMHSFMSSFPYSLNHYEETTPQNLTEDKAAHRIGQIVSRSVYPKQQRLGNRFFCRHHHHHHHHPSLLTKKESINVKMYVK